MNKKITAVLIVLTLLFSPILMPRRVYATGIPVVDVAQVIQNIWIGIIQPTLLTVLKRQILDVVVDQIIGYIQGEGKPKFVTNWKDFAEDVGQAAAGEFAQSAGLNFLCSPFQLQIRFAVLPVPKFSEQVQCTLDDIVKNVQDFYNDFRNGGWLAYGTSWQPQNNFFGALLEVSKELNLRKEAAVLAGLNEAAAGGGFLSWKDEAGNIHTPGSTAKDLVSKAVGTDIDFILSADELGDYVGAIANALINRVIQEGVAKIQKVSSRQEVDSANAQYEASVVANAFEPEKTIVTAQINETLVPRQQAQATIDVIIAKLNQYKIELNKISADLRAAASYEICTAETINNVQNQISAEVAQADSEIANLLEDTAENQSYMEPLDNALAEINQLSATRAGLSRLSEINYEVSPNLNPDAAIDLRTVIDEQAGAVSQNITSKLAEFNQQLKQCQRKF